jgi:fumarate reductase subunit C
MKEIIGWRSAMVLIPTFGLQAYKQWQNRDEHAPASTLWFFILALIGVVGQVAYSWLLGNWVYFVLNACLVVTNILGLALAIHRRGMSDHHANPEATDSEAPYTKIAQTNQAPP